MGVKFWGVEEGPGEGCRSRTWHLGGRREGRGGVATFLALPTNQPTDPPRQKFHHEKTYKERHIFIDPTNLTFCWAKSSALKDLTAAKSYQLSAVQAVRPGPPSKGGGKEKDQPHYTERTVTVLGAKKEAVDLLFDSPEMCSTWCRALRNIVGEFHRSSDFVGVQESLSDRMALAELVSRGNSFEAFGMLDEGGGGGGGGGGGAAHRPTLGDRKASLTTYAQNNFQQTSNSGGMFSSKKKAEPEDLVNHSVRPIRRPLTQIPTKLEKKAVQTFSLVLK